MFRWLRTLAREVRDRVRYSGKISPESIRRLAEELQELAAIAERMHSDPSERSTRIRHIRSEVVQLMDLTERMEFHRLSAQRRLELHHSLVQSRDQLLDSMRSVPVPTDRIQ